MNSFELTAVRVEDFVVEVGLERAFGARWLGWVRASERHTPAPKNEWARPRTPDRFSGRTTLPDPQPPPSRGLYWRPWRLDRDSRMGRA